MPVRRPLAPLALLLCWILSPAATAAPLVFGHRGASAEAPANSLLAFRRAALAGADGVELDVRRVRTGELVVVHDRTLHRPDGAPLGRVERLSLAEVQAVDLGQGQRIPTFDQALAAMPPGLRINVEIKAERLRPTGVERDVVRAIRAHGLGARVVVSSFNPLALRRVRRLAPELPTGLLVARSEPFALGTLVARLVRARAIHPEASRVTARRVARWHARGLAVTPWTVDDPARLRTLAALRVDGLITNDPRRARRVLGPARRSAGRARR